MKILHWCSFILFCSATAHAQSSYPFGPPGAPTWQFTVPSVAALPAVGNTLGDARIETTAFNVYVWNGVAWQCDTCGGGGGTVTSVSVVPTNGFDGTVATPNTTPAITIKTTLAAGLISSNGANAIIPAPSTDVTSKVLTGFLAGAGVVAATDTILQAFNKIVGNAAAYLSNALTSGHIFVGSAGNVATDTAVSGDFALSNTGVATINPNVVDNTKLAQMPANTLKGNNTGVLANAIDLTVAQATAMLNQFTNLLQGLVPASGGGVLNFLRADGTWAVPPGSGPGSGTVTDVSVTNTNGFDGSVTNPTTTASITISTTVNGILKGISPTVVPAIPGVDYQAPLFSITAPVNEFVYGFNPTNTFLTKQPNFYQVTGTVTADKMMPLPQNNIYVGNSLNYPVSTPANAFIIGQILNGFVSGTGIVTAADSILSAFNKVVGNLGALLDNALTTKGDLLTRDGVSITRLPIGANTFVLTADSTTSTGMKWAAGGGGSSAVYSAYVGDSGNTACATNPCGFVIDTDTPFISSVGHSSTGVYTINSSVTFPHTMRCTVSVSSGGAQDAVAIMPNYSSATTTTFTFYTTSLTTLAPINSNFFIHCQ